jgi:RNA polymerase sigma-70 factor, ECF subfamily
MREDADYARRLAPLLTLATGYARSLLRNMPDAEDAVQQAALRGFERFETFDVARPFKGWWFAILRNSCIDALRRRKADNTSSLGDYDPPDERRAESADWERLDDAIARLSPDHREILRLRYFGDLSYAELAETLRIPQGTVMSRLHLARKALARFMNEEAL